MARHLRRLGLAARHSPLVLLAVLSVASFAARAAWLGDPCRVPCRSASDHTLVFDETYYVNAARVIAGIRPPTGAPYAHAPLGDDPNAEHPPLAKLVIAGSIELFGDGPFAWRLPSVLLGSLALIGMFVLARAAGASRWMALGAAALLAADNLLIVHGRIGTLDIYAVTAMIWAAACYLRGRAVLAGLLIAVGALAKEVAPYLLITFALLELARAWPVRAGLRAAAVRFGTCACTAAAAFVAGLALLDRLAPPYDPLAGKLVSGGVFGEIGHIFGYATAQRSPLGPHGIASYPWQWLFDYKPITYLYVDPAHPADGLYHIHPAVHFLGMISPPIMLLALPAVILAVRRVLVARRAEPGGPAFVGAAWLIGTWAPYELLSLIWSRTSYLYYMVIVMPGIYLAVADLVARFGVRRKLSIAWIGAVLLAAILMYPLTPLP